MDSMFSMIAAVIITAGVLFAVQIPLRKSEHTLIRVILFILKAVMIPGTALLFVAVNWEPAFRHGDILTAVYTALCGDTAAGTAEFAVRRIYGAIKKQQVRKCMMMPLFIMTAVFTAVVIIYGCLNAGSITEKSITVSAEGLARSHTFAFVSDIHAEDARSTEHLYELCRQINAERPEFVILGGDITDELTSYEDMLTTYSILSEIEAPVYFIYGNHDRQPSAYRTGGRTYSDEDLAAAISGAGFTILRDECVKTDDDLFLLGREDISMGEARKQWEELALPAEGALVVADHQPYDEHQLTAEVSALQISGHTHAGQLWPLQTVYRILGLPAYGLFDEPGTKLYVSSGVSEWVTPVRTEEQCEWVLITLVPQ